MAALSNSNWGFYVKFERRTSATCLSFLLLAEEASPCPWLSLEALEEPSHCRGLTPLLDNSLSFFLFFRLAGTKGLTKEGRGRRRGEESEDLEVSLGADPLALPVRSSQRPLFFYSGFSSSSSSSSESLAMRVTMNPEVRTLENLSSSSSKSVTWITGFPYSFVPSSS